MSSWYFSSTRPRTSRVSTGRSSRIQNEQMNEMKVMRMTLPTLTMPPMTPFARPLASAPACWRMKDAACVSSELMLSPSKNCVEELALVTKSWICERYPGSCWVNEVSCWTMAGMSTMKQATMMAMMSRNAMVVPPQRGMPCLWSLLTKPCSRKTSSAVTMMTATACQMMPAM